MGARADDEYTVATLSFANAVSVAQARLLPTPQAPTVVPYSCTEDYMRVQMSKAKAALEISDWSMVMVVQLAGENASQCYDQLQYPYYDVLKAYFYFQAARLYLREQPPNIQQATILNAAAKSALGEASKYDLPADQLKLLAAVKPLARQTLSELTYQYQQQGPASVPETQGPPVTINVPPESDQNPSEAANEGPSDASAGSYSVLPLGCGADAQRPRGAIMSGMIGKPETWLGASFENEAGVTLTDVHVQYDFLNAFGDVIDSIDGTWSGSFAPGVIINFMPPGVKGSLEKPLFADVAQIRDVHCNITAARWSDGTVRRITDTGTTSANGSQSP